MKKAIGLAAIVIFIVACGSQDTGRAGIPEPKVTIEQTSNLPVVAEHMTGGMSVALRMNVTNNAAIPISLKRAELLSIGEGGWNLRQTQRQFDHIVQPGTTESFDFWVEAESGSSIAGNNAPVTVRLTTVFDSTAGSFTHVTMQHVGGQVQ